MSMTIGELIKRLEEYRDEFSEDAEVRLMTEQNWPFENSICGVCSGLEINEAAAEDEPEEEVVIGTDKDAVVYLVEGRQLCYGSKLAWEVAHGR